MNLRETIRSCVERAGPMESSDRLVNDLEAALLNTPQNGPVIDLYHVALQQIREAYIAAFGPLDPNIMGNDIDYHICEIIKNAALKDQP